MVLSFLKVVYDDSIITTRGGLTTTDQYFEGRPGYQILAIKSNNGAILISKDPVQKQNLSMAFVCGKRLEQSDLSVVTALLYDYNGQQQIGCNIDIQTTKEAAFYCPAPYVRDPPNCFDQVSVNGELKDLSGISQSLVASHSNHFVTLKFESKRVGLGEKRRQTPPLECRCVTIKGVVLSTIQIENYYAK
ncbi:hypothetical protein BBBOND_0205870 [Babesia bigemina]|uniref:6-Cys domain-containing protein n=1 Tax=Babesia bigemina TaxID=5866 RepID=A0A061DCA0_BABBI|nr:hypothetical protein BBBOND_0205830 [Babesia bigemina]XP_012767615.1 hypothetical protein BBBOND_0205870 [Babesia bigemina]CDR95425.1 hypothetical protein BBBOND_0205830 [Babesia bigemina]CDR95429.1 hypothetical protein BBBOND_0205870 [Babesia bigemina]|eukprot:XP_012767611.1 hypothetical protein BBBOND_0205830 [Babesia bigemina]